MNVRNDMTREADKPQKMVLLVFHFQFLFSFFSSLPFFSFSHFHHSFSLSIFQILNIILEFFFISSYSLWGILCGE